MMVFSFLFVAAGLLGVGSGLLGFAATCNRYADATVTWCGPGLVLGSSVFNISYVDDDRHTHVGRIEREWTPCLPSSTLQTVRVCYPLSDPGDFRTNEAVVFDDPRSAPVYLILGVSCFSALVMLMVIIDRAERRIPQRSAMEPKDDTEDDSTAMIRAPLIQCRG